MKGNGFNRILYYIDVVKVISTSENKETTMGNRERISERKDGTDIYEESDGSVTVEKCGEVVDRIGPKAAQRLNLHNFYKEDQNEEGK